jgi:8-amino-7-oxononanoate synthase
MSRFDAVFDQALVDAQARNRRRRLRPLEPLDGGRVRLDGQVLIDLSSNDYLGLSRHPALIERSREWASRFGVGSGASRLVRGSFHAHHAVEGKLAALKGAEAALLFASGWQANAAVLPAVFKAAADADGAPPQVFADFLAHSSLRVGCRAAGVRPIRFRHNDLQHLEALLTEQSESPGRRFILTESVFSMDGDRVDLDALLRIAERWDAFVYLDEAHATGVLGPLGMGMSAAMPGRVDLAMGTFSKAMGSFGAYVAGSRSLIDYLTGACSGFVYTTAPPPPVLGAIHAALDLVPGMEAERAHLRLLADRLRAGLKEAGLDVGPSTTQIVPAILGGEAETLALSARLEAEGVLAVAIRPPTVPEGASRIRFSLSAAHSEADVDRLVGLLIPATQRRSA